MIRRELMVARISVGVLAVLLGAYGADVCIEILTAPPSGDTWRCP